MTATFSVISSTVRNHPTLARIWPLTALPLYDHLCNTLTSERLASLECLSFDTREEVEAGREKQENRCGNQTGDLDRNTDPLNDTHHSVDGGAHVIGLESTDEGIERRRSWADTEKKRNLDEDDQEGIHSGRKISFSPSGRGAGYVGMSPTYKQSAVKMIMRGLSKLKMLAIPNAKQRNMHKTPVLLIVSIDLPAIFQSLIHAGQSA